MKVPQAFLFDLDGVLVDTAKFHYQSWRRLAGELGFDLTEADNERLKGVSRLASLDIVLGIGGIRATDADRARWADAKNQWYVELLANLSPHDILPNAEAFVRESRRSGLKTAVASASKNAVRILEALKLVDQFDEIVDGTTALAAKPDPEVFLTAAAHLGVAPGLSVVFEDSAAGVEAAHRAGMPCVGIGRPVRLSAADIVVTGFVGLSPRSILAQLHHLPAS